MSVLSSVIGAPLLALAVLVAPVSAHALVYTTVLLGATESPPSGSSGGGAAIVSFDLDLSTMRVQTTFAGLTGKVTASHLHCCTAVPGAGTVGVASQTPYFAGFPLGGTFGSYDHTFDMTQASSYSASFLAANGGTPGTAFSALLAGVDAGRTYLNVHTTTSPGGEIRGFLAPVPEPQAVALMSLGLAAIGWRARRRAST